MSVDATPERLVVPPDRRGPRLRLLLALALAGAGAVLAIWGWSAGRTASLVGGAALAGFFLVASVVVARRLGRRHPLLVVDREGLSLDDDGEALRVGWDAVVSVRCLARRLQRGVLLELRDDASSDETREVLIGAEHLRGAPPEWLAGLLETFRSRPDLRARLGPEAKTGEPQA